MVVDELGSIQGLVTINDVFEEIAGSLDMQDLEHNPEIVQRDESSWLLDGGVGLDELRELTGRPHLSGEGTGYFRTVGGLVMYHLGRVPATADMVVVDGVHYEVVDMDGRRVDKVLVTLPTTLESAEAAGDTQAAGS
jgi:putative hemolysin